MGGIIAFHAARAGAHITANSLHDIRTCRNIDAGRGVGALANAIQIAVTCASGWWAADGVLDRAAEDIDRPDLLT
eukprot:16449375-Heterocapsa_arctica.AAC.2